MPDFPRDRSAAAAVDVSYVQITIFVKKGRNRDRELSALFRALRPTLFCAIIAFFKHVVPPRER
jgi:hypothetical protein